MVTSEYPVREQIAKDIRALIRPCAEVAETGVFEDCVQCAANAALESAAQVAEKVRHADSWVTPDWVMVGVPSGEFTANLPGPYAAGPGSVMVLASTQLTGAEFIREVTGHDRVPIRADMRPAVLPTYRSTLLAEIASFQTVYAANYPAALRELLSRPGWGPPAGATPPALPFSETHVPTIPAMNAHDAPFFCDQCHAHCRPQGNPCSCCAAADSVPLAIEPPD